MTERYVDTLARLLTKARYRHTTDELMLQQELASHLALLGVKHEREVRLSGKDRIDFLCGTIGIEVKVAGSANNVTAQLLRYAESERVTGLVLFTTRAQIVVPRVLNEKPVARSLYTTL